MHKSTRFRPTNLLKWQNREILVSQKFSVLQLLPKNTYPDSEVDILSSPPRHLVVIGTNTLEECSTDRKHPSHCDWGSVK